MAESIGDLTVAEKTTVPTDPVRIEAMKELWRQMQMKDEDPTLGICIHCGHSYYKHSFRTWDGAVDCRQCDKDMDTGQVVCYLGEPTLDDKHRKGGRFVSLSFVPAFWFYSKKRELAIRVDGTAKFDSIQPNP